MEPLRAHLSPKHRLPLWRAVTLWLCVSSLLVVLAARVPRFSSGSGGWERLAPSQLTAKVLFKDLSLLPPAPSRVFVVQPNPVRLPVYIGQAPSPYLSLLDSRLCNRPPPLS